MSKKSRRRNKKILGALAAGLGAMALMRGRGTAQGVSGSDKAKFTSDAAYTGDVTGTNYPGANKFVETAPKYKFSKRSNRGAADYNKTIPFDPSQGNTSPKWFSRFDRSNLGSGWMAKGGRAGHKSGGRVGCGKAKRGFGRALKKGK